LTFSGIMVSSLDDPRVFARRDTVSLLNREPSLEVLVLLFEFTEGERSGIASTLVVVDTSFGVDIWLGSTRLRMDGVYFRLSPRFVREGFLFNASMAASVFC